jgi:hypothetical protein
MTATATRPPARTDLRLQFLQQAAQHLARRQHHPVRRRRRPPALAAVPRKAETGTPMSATARSISPTPQAILLPRMLLSKRLQCSAKPAPGNPNPWQYPADRPRCDVCRSGGLRRYRGRALQRLRRRRHQR